MIYKYNDFSVLLVIDKSINKEMFLSKAGVVKGGYAEDMFTRIYDSIFSELVNLEEEFEQYYKIEYENIKKFLYKKYSLTPEMINDIFSTKEEKKTYCIYHKKEEHSYGDYGIFEFAFSDRMYDKITNILLMK